jgi:hypothetical protein
VEADWELFQHTRLGTRLGFGLIPSILSLLLAVLSNLASVALPMFVKPNKEFDFQKLYEVVYVMTKNLNRVIDINYYPVKRQ